MNAPSESLVVSKKWSKTLYERNAFPDNYTDPKFLVEIKRNLHFKPIDWKTAMLQATRISTQISITVIFWAVFKQLQENSGCWELTYGLVGVFILGSYVISFCMDQAPSMMRNVILFTGLGYGCTPILQTLTDTISTDSIYAMSITLMLIHITFHEYGMDGGCVSPYVSLNAAICGAICLASRLQETTHAYVLLALALQGFVLFPNLYQALDYNPIVFFISTSGAFMCMTFFSVQVAVLFLVVITCVNVIIPLCYVWAQRYKDNIYGPWDEAMIFSR